MYEEVKSKRKKKLFEWDCENRVMSIIIKNKMYLCELDADGKFKCLSEKNKIVAGKLNTMNY